MGANFACPKCETRIDPAARLCPGCGFRPRHATPRRRGVAIMAVGAASVVLGLLMAFPGCAIADRLGGEGVVLSVGFLAVLPLLGGLGLLVVGFLVSIVESLRR
jgi:hypothetical protein